MVNDAKFTMNLDVFDKNQRLTMYISMVDLRAMNINEIYFQ